MWLWVWCSQNKGERSFRRLTPQDTKRNTKRGHDVGGLLDNTEGKNVDLQRTNSRNRSPFKTWSFPRVLVDWCRVCLCKQLLSSVQWPVKTLIMWFLICFSNNISKIIHLVLMWWGRGSVFKCTCLWLTGLPLNRLTNSVVDSGFYLFIYPRGFFYIIERHFREMKTDPESVCFDVADEVRR